MSDLASSLADYIQELPVNERSRTARDLRAAADFIRRHGWIKRHISTPEGVCLVGLYLW